MEIPIIHLLLLFQMLGKALSLATPSFSTASNKRIALVTGANKGIGKEIVRLLGKEKHIITILTCRSPDASIVLGNLIQELWRHLVIGR